MQLFLSKLCAVILSPVHWFNYILYIMNKNSHTTNTQSAVRVWQAKRKWWFWECAPSPGLHTWWCYISLCFLPPLCLPLCHWSIFVVSALTLTRASLATPRLPRTINQTRIPVSSGQYLIAPLSLHASYFTWRCAAFLTELSWTMKLILFNC